MRHTLVRLRAQAIQHDLDDALEEAFATAAPNYMLNRLMAAQGALEDFLASLDVPPPQADAVIRLLELTLRGWARFSTARPPEERHAA